MNNNINNKPNTELNELFTLLIELGNNESEYLKIYEDSIPEKLAYNFCLEHNLDFSSLQNLTKEIKRTLYKTKQKEKTNNSFEIHNQSPLKNNEQLKESNSLKDIHSDNKTEKKDIKNNINKQKYNFKDISKNLKSPVIYQFKIIIKDENVSKKKAKIKNKKFEKNMYFVGNKPNMAKEDNCNNYEKKERIKTSYLSSTESSRSKIKKSKEKNKEKNKQNKKYNSSNNIKIINIINNNNINNSMNNLVNNNINKHMKKNKGVNYGEILYQKGIKSKEISKKKTENKINKDKKEKEIYTFKPSINPINIKSIKYIKDKNKHSNQNIEKSEQETKKEVNKVDENSKDKKEENVKIKIFNVKSKQNSKEKLNHYNDKKENIDNLNNNNSNKDKKIEKDKNELINKDINLDKKEIKEKINGNKNNKEKDDENNNNKIKNENNISSISKEKNILRSRPNSSKPKKTKQKMPIYEKLYNQKNSIKLIENKIYNKNELFKPKTNSNYKGLYNNKPFSQRQIIYKAKSAERKKQLNQQTYPKFDTKTGQKLFHPLINKNYNRTRTSLNSNMYLNVRSGKMKREELQKRFYMEKKFKDFRANEKSENLFENQIIKSFKKIFLVLDKNQNGKLSQFNYNIKELPDNIKKIIYPILNKIDLKNKILNEDNFIYECKKLYKTLNYYDKKEIYNFADINEQKKSLIISSTNLEDNSEKNNKYSYYCLTNSDQYTYDNNLTGSCYKLKSETFSNNKDKFSKSNYDVNDYYINSNNFLNLNGNSSNYKTFYGNSFESRKKKYFENLVIQRLQEEILDFQI